MLRSASLRWKILAILLLPTVIIAGLSVALVQRAADRSHAEILGLLAVVAVLVPIAQGLIVARRVTEPLRRLTAHSQAISAELPALVQRANTTGEGTAAFSPLPVTGHDEIGRVAASFNEVNDTTVRLVMEQAALRASIGKMFVNVARRNQALLGRQLHVLERLEEREEREDVLEDLFNVDHLTTRMQRNAESLLVLAGIDSTRRSRQPLALSDVIRTAVSEIEQYSRVDLQPGIDPDVEARHVMVAAHLVAELLENATRFSDPDTRVDVHLMGTPVGVNVLVVDHGLGMSPADIEQANQTIAEPPTAEIAVSDRLGFFVVGRLARKLGAAVRLHPGEQSGVVAVISLPVPIFRLADVPEQHQPEQYQAEEPQYHQQYQPEQQQYQPEHYQPEQPRPVGVPTHEDLPLTELPPTPMPERPAVPQQQAPQQQPSAYQPQQAPAYQPQQTFAPAAVPAAAEPSASAAAIQQLQAYHADVSGPVPHPAPAAAVHQAAPQQNAYVYAPDRGRDAHRTGSRGQPERSRTDEVPALAPMSGELPPPVIPLVAPPAPGPGEPGPAAGYLPTFAEPTATAAPAELTRRAPRRIGTEQADDPLTAAFADVERDAAGHRDPKAVQGNLSSFRSAVQRARADASSVRPIDEPRN